MREGSYWLDTTYSPRPSLAKDTETDVAIIGGGIAGVATAYYCAQQGLRTVLVEQNTIASGAAGKNAGMVVEGCGLDLIELVERYGESEAKERWQRTIDAREEVERLIREIGIDCDFSHGGSLYAGCTPNEIDVLKKETAIRKRMGFIAEFITKEKLLEGPLTGAVYNPADCLLNPVKFVRGLARAAESHGALLYEGTPATHFDDHHIETPHGTIQATQVVSAIESYKYLEKEIASLWHGEIVVTAPISQAALASLKWNTGAMLWIMGAQDDAMRRIGSRLLYYRSIKATQPRGSDELVVMLRYWLPSLAAEPLKIASHWEGAMVLSSTDCPKINNHAGYWTIEGHGGNGLTNGVATGKALAQSFSGATIPALYTK